MVKRISVCICDVCGMEIKDLNSLIIVRSEYHFCGEKCINEYKSDWVEIELDSMSLENFLKVSGLILSRGQTYQRDIYYCSMKKQDGDVYMRKFKKESGYGSFVGYGGDHVAAKAEMKKNISYTSILINVWKRDQTIYHLKNIF